MNKKINKKKIIVLIAIICIVIAIVVIVKKPNNDSSKYENITNASQEMLNNISYEYTLGKEGKFILTLKNNNNANLVGLNLNVQFYKDNELLGQTVQYIYMLEANKEYILGMFSHIGDASLLNDENVKITIEAQENAKYEIDNSKVSITTNEENGVLKVEAKNTSDKTIDLQANIIFYKEDKIVSAKEWNDIIAKEQSKTQELTKSLDTFGSEIEYDNYKIFYNANLISE